MEAIGDGQGERFVAPGVLDGAGGDGGDVAVEARELPEGHGDAAGELLLKVALGLEVLTDAFEVGLPLARLLDAGDDGVGGEDAVFGGSPGGGLLALLGLRAAVLALSFGALCIVLGPFFVVFRAGVLNLSRI